MKTKSKTKTKPTPKKVGLYKGEEMLLNCYQEVEELTKELVSISSINKAPGEETEIAKFICDYYLKLAYFKQHPERVIYQKTKKDFVDRHNAISYVKGTKDGGSKKTVILLGHIDTVGVEDFGEYKDYATKPDELPEILKKHFVLSKEILDDMESGKYMFGRGALDMKAGVAGHMALISYFSEHPEELKGNLIAIHECDEEDNSKGVITALDLLVELREKEGLEYIACINADYSTNHSPEDKNCYIYHGSIGKLLPCCSVFGKEAHVGQSFAAFDPNLLTAMITKNVSLNPLFSDKAQGETTLPPISLKQSDSKPEYTVQTALNTLSYYNVFSHGRSPADVLRLFKEMVIASYDETVTLLQSRYDAYCELAEIPPSSLPWRTRVFTWEELVEELLNQDKTFLDELHAFKEMLHKEQPALDLRLYSHEVAKFAQSKLKDKSPFVVIYFGSIYNARVETTGETPKEKALLESVDKALELVQPHAKRSIKTRRFYPYISDSSFMAVCDSEEAIERLRRNMPSYTTKYVHEVEKILQINVPVVNIGSFGKDGHMLTERVDKWQTFHNVPNISYHTILSLLD